MWHLIKFLLDVTQNQFMQMLKKGDYKLHKAHNFKKLIKQTMETVLHATTVRKRLWHENGVQVCFSIGEMSD